jgi:hypothetical protein
MFCTFLPSHFHPFPADLESQIGGSKELELFWAGTQYPWREKQKSNGKIFAYLTKTALPPLLICSFLVWSPWTLAFSFSLYNRHASGIIRSFLQHGW